MVNRPMEIDWVKYFKCKKCWEVKPLNKCYFHINTMFSTGFNSKCKSCVKEERESKPKIKYITRAELEEENKKLEEKLDNRDSLLEWKRKEVQTLFRVNEELTIENKKLKSDLEECECSFWFESDEVWFWKREYKRLKKWIKDHCKWYWNLFPEDEMKRQWKKADKKRK